MIRSAVLRLCLAYLSILMAMSIGFSILLFSISSHELNEELRRPDSYELVQPGLFLNFDEFRDARLSQARKHLITNLFILNFGTFAAGSLLSYGLAKRTLQPIQQALEAQSRFTADASHELRTPLTALQTEIEVALRDKKLSLADAKQQLISNLEEVIKLRTLTDRLLSLARDNEEIRIQKTSLKKVANTARVEVNNLAANKQIKIVDETKAVNVLANPQHLQDCIVILLDNAIKYSNQKTVIKLRTGRQQKNGYLSIVDQGSGIAANDLPHIFDRFYRANQARSNDNSGGYGLGLSIADQLISAQGGWIEAESQVGKGSTFTIALPLYSKQ